MPHKDPEERRAYARAWQRAYAAAHPDIIKERARIKHARHRAEHNAKARAAYQRNRDENTRIARAYYHAHKEERQAAHKVWREKHTEHRAVYNKRYRIVHHDRLKAAARADYYENRKVIRSKSRAFGKAHPEIIKGYNRSSYIANEEQRRAYAKAYRLAHPEESRAAAQRHRARKLHGANNDLTAAQWKEIKEHYGHRCVYCGKKSQRLTQDHITPLSKGGNHTASNVVPACRSCNSRKHTGPPLRPVQPLMLTIAPTRKSTLVHSEELEGDQ